MNGMMDWIRRKRDICSVTYSRFGVPGDVVEDRVPPSAIYLAQFDDNDPRFIFFKLCHVQKAAVAVAGFGMSFVLLMFISAFFEFDWLHHRSGVDLIALVSLFLYLSVGITIHYQVINAIKQQQAKYLLPFIVMYTIAIESEIALAFLHLWHINTPVDFGYKEETNSIYIFTIITFMIIIFVQGSMLAAILQCRYYLSCKQTHSIAINVAEKSHTRYPGIQVVFLDANNELSAQTRANADVLTSVNTDKVVNGNA